MQEKSVLICEDTLDGIFTAVYDGFKDALSGKDVAVCTAEPDSPEFFCRYHTVDTSPEKSVKVARSIKRKLGLFVYEAVCYAAASLHPDKGTAIFWVLYQALSGGRYRRDIMEDMADPWVNLVSKLRIRVWHEIHHYFGFVRFREAGGRVLLSRIQPENDILALLAPHFSNRFPNENWVIYDEGRRQALIHPRQGPGVIRRDVSLSSEYLTGLEAGESYEELWRAFCESITIQERKNPGLQKQLLPLRYRGDMPEFHDARVQKPFPT